MSFNLDSLSYLVLHEQLSERDNDHQQNARPEEWGKSAKYRNHTVA
jgi:hypothetical protein